MMRLIPGVAMKKTAIILGIFGILCLVSHCSESYQSHYDLAKWYADKGLTNEAILEFKAATQVNPKRYEGHYNLAIAYTKKGWYEYALKEAELAFDLHPSDETYKLIQVVRDKKILESSQALMDSTATQ